MHRLLNACVAIMCVVKEVTVASKRALASHTPAFPPIPPLFSPVFPVFPHFPPFSPIFPHFPPFPPIFPIFPIFPWPKKDLETPGWETSKACVPSDEELDLLSNPLLASPPGKQVRKKEVKAFESEVDLFAPPPTALCHGRM